MGGGVRSKIQDTRHKTQDTRHKTQIVDRLQVADCRWQKGADSIYYHLRFFGSADGLSSKPFCDIISR
ncbi:hypothetical protein A2336_00980 [Candidatus Peregrinibacteria bacterium RIFOXYB2_FULL_41_88]|nr:MAG: hypothetical protein A2244_01780 [Candidatus Peregrinibacteria bacterium RIFOXYA2_FULL_41_18]OGJ52760.1 MAG: hypothetical protein A2336_00980 [Candidatus Peregrinibacteria bacterium RIFOXYB2_FULL_41_88]OGJ52906.1 MAG: hypothetical protein A2448_02050 [Candidatus Peregrinibacteria bacterium RIFOXYC2_FULL_41_22]